MGDTAAEQYVEVDVTVMQADTSGDGEKDSGGSHADGTGTGGAEPDSPGTKYGGDPAGGTPGTKYGGDPAGGTPGTKYGGGPAGGTPDTKYGG
jgi:hypothetical protein